MPSWQFVLCDKNGDALGDLGDATAKTVTYTRNGVPEVQMVCSHEQHCAEMLLEYLADGIPTCKAYRDGTLRFHGYLAPFQEELEDTATLQLTFRGPFGRVLGDGTGRGRFNNGGIIGYGPAEASVIAGILLDIAQTGQPSLAASWIGITDGTFQVTGQNRERANDGSFNYVPLGEEMLHLTRIIDGFDFEVEPLEGVDSSTGFPLMGRMNVYTRQGSDQTAAVFEYGTDTVANVRKVTRQWFHPVNFARVVGPIIAPATDPIVGEYIDEASAAIYGKWEQQESRTDINEQATLTARAKSLIRPRPVRVVSFTPEPPLAPSPWDDYWLGDTVYFRGRRGAFFEDVATRVNQIRVVVDDEGNEASEIAAPDDETITAAVESEIVEVGQENVGGTAYHKPTFESSYGWLDRRISALERTQERA